ncbi:MAG: fused MFS/spermidine synthase [Verrucomicrobia bacterium]|nr:fused MFS/spermidine synthase [Verrucomicrobiota bacterium]
MTENDTSWEGSVQASSRVLPWLLLLFIGSGCAALIYEIVWLQLLQLVIGLTTVSLGVLLGTFMGGMCLGSLLLPRLISSRRHPLRVYAVLELGIGVIGVAVLFGMPYLSQLYTAKGGQGFSGMILRGAVAAVCLLPPTLLMGATLPAISRWVETTPQGVSWLGFFYGGNIAGAVFGCLLAGFYLLRVHDMATATYAAASINGVVGLAALLLAFFTRHGPNRLSPHRDRQRDEAPPANSEHRHLASEVSDSLSTNISVGPACGPALPRNLWAVYLTIALSGLAALGAEVVWTRLLSLLLGGTVYTFSIILAVFLVGLGIGSSAGSFLSRTTLSPRLALGCCQLLLVAATAWTASMIAHSLPFWPVNPSLSQSPWLTFQLDVARCLWAILPAAILWGASFPLALAAVASPGQDPGRLVGGVYAANTLGAIFGALVFSMVVIPQVGTQWAQRLLIGTSSVAALFMLAPLVWNIRPNSPGLGRRGCGAATVPKLEITHQKSEIGQSLVTSAATRLLGHTVGAIALAFAIGLAVLLAWRVSPAPWGLTAYGRFMATYGNRLAPGVIQEKDIPSAEGPADIFCAYLGEGLNGSVAVTKWASGELSFHSAGKVQASNEPNDMRLQRMLGHISALAHAKPESVLVVACGAGVTAGTFVLHPDVKRIVICDIEPLVPKFVAPMFAKENYGVVKDPRTTVVHDDGRHFIRTTKEQFDIITSDPIDPWVKGCAALNTVEYYEMCKQHLKPGGVMSLWIPLYESNPDTAKSVIATFFKVFPNGILWSNDIDGEGYDAVLFGQAERTQMDVDKLQERLNREDHALVKKSLQEVGFESVTGLLATYAGQAPDLQEWMRDAQINTDRNLRLQYLAGLWLNSNRGAEILDEIIRYRRFPDSVFLGSAGRTQSLRRALEGSGAAE